MSVMMIGICCLLELLVVENVVAKGRHYVRIGCEQNMKLWTVHSINGLLCVMIYLAFFPGNPVWEKEYASQMIYVGILLGLLVLVELISPSRQLLFFFRKAPKKDSEELHEIEESFDRFYQFLVKILLVLLLNLAVIKVMIYVLFHQKWGLTAEKYDSMGLCLVYAAGVFLLLFSCISFRQMITQLCLIKKGYFRQDIFQTLRKKDDIQEHLRARHRKL